MKAAAFIPALPQQRRAFRIRPCLLPFLPSSLRLVQAFPFSLSLDFYPSAAVVGPVSVQVISYLLMLAFRLPRKMVSAVKRRSGGLLRGGARGRTKDIRVSFRLSFI